MIGRALFQTRVRDIATSEQDLAAGRKLHVMRHVQILERLLHDPLEDWRADLASLVQANGGVEDYHHCELGIVDGSKSGERPDILRLRISTRGWIHLLGSSRFPRRTVALKNGSASSAMQHHSLQHLAHLGRGQR